MQYCATCYTTTNGTDFCPVFHAPNCAISTKQFLNRFPKSSIQSNAAPSVAMMIPIFDISNVDDNKLQSYPWNALPSSFLLMEIYEEAKSETK